MIYGRFNLNDVSILLTKQKPGGLISEFSQHFYDRKQMDCFQNDKFTSEF